MRWRNLELSEEAWKHIVADRNRDYFERLFDKIVETIRNPEQVRRSVQEKDVVIYERFFKDFYIANTVLGHAYVNVVANWNTNRIRTAYPSLKKRQKGSLLWPKK